MKKILSMFALFALVGALCIGCNKPESTPKDEAETKADAAKVPADKDWKPEADKPVDADGEDHTGHNHAPGEHQD